MIKKIKEHLSWYKEYKTKCRYLSQCTLYFLYFLSFISANYKIWIHGRYKVFKTLTFSAVQNVYTGYFLSEVLILASINPKYDNRLFFELQGSVLGNFIFSTCCVHQIVFVFTFRTIWCTYVCTRLCTELVVFLYYKLVIQRTICHHILG